MWPSSTSHQSHSRGAGLGAADLVRSEEAPHAGLGAVHVHQSLQLPPPEQRLRSAPPMLFTTTFRSKTGRARSTDALSVESSRLPGAQARVTAT